MPAFEEITASDANDVEHVFAPLTLIGNEAKFVDRATGITVGYPVITVQTSQPSKTSRLSKVRMKVVMPILETVNASTYNGITPAPTKAFDLTFDAMFFLPERSNLSQRKDLLAIVRGVIDGELAATLVETQETIY